MAFNGSGVFERLFSWAADKAANIKIRADRMDQEMNGFATGLSNCITRDGQSTVTQHLPFNGKRLMNIGAPEDDGDAMSRGVADARFRPRTVAKTANYTVAPTDIASVILATGSWTLTLPAVGDVSNGFSVTLKNEGTGRITIDPDGSELINGRDSLVAFPGGSMMLLCDGAAWHAIYLTSENGWQSIADIDIKIAVATADVALPAGWRSLRISGLWVPDQIVSDNTLGARFSTDNGSTYKAGANDYVGSTLSQTGSAVGAAGSVPSTYWRAGGATDNSVVVCAFQAVVNQNAGAKVPSMFSCSSGYSSGGTTLVYRGGYCNFAGITNVRFMAANGNIGVGTRLSLEACF